MFFNKKRKEELEKLRIEKIFACIQGDINLNSQKIEFIKNYGNSTQRHNNKLSIADYMKCRDDLISYSVPLQVAAYIINSDKKLIKLYNDLMQKIDAEFTRRIKEREQQKSIKPENKDQLIVN